MDANSGTYQRTQRKGYDNCVQQARKAHSNRVWPTSKTWPKRDQPIPLPKLTQANLEQARSRLNILKISSQAHTPSSQV
ncbi:hypothetical protein PIB30_098183 [Stylosanthes scabra]|uniref:Uncharacterized protein n=1 Tax=Stylosanthes scabra TaxID=79078 RepID=A0ABU6XY41_9FABA|nr:hypothetical protein [Stylosanthes scabra]